ncbi:hypothetical protein V6N12_015168 [Hibiscus sabdariffa]|uniref:Uncharacterized protein n=1 Tax=Hibiscus sabdariffa TaxID=183260 RepID=A0ABR2DMC3_9ROSI
MYKLAISVVVRLLGRSIGYTALLNRIKALWKLSGAILLAPRRARRATRRQEGTQSVVAKPNINGAVNKVDTVRMEEDSNVVGDSSRLNQSRKVQK